MRKPVFVKIASAISVCSLLASTSSITVYAEEPEPTPAVNNTIIYADEGDTEVHNGDIKKDGLPEEGIYYGVAVDNGGNITVNGKVEFISETNNQGAAVYAQNSNSETPPSYIYIKKDVSSTDSDVVIAEDNAIVEIGGSVTAPEYTTNVGIIAKDNATVTVEGDVIGNQAVEVNDTATVNVGGDINGSAMIQGGTVKVKGDVSNGIVMGFEPGKEQGSVVIGNMTYNIVIFTPDETYTDVAPQIVVYEIEDPEITVFTQEEGLPSTEYEQAVAESVCNAIQYIIHIKGNGYTLEGAGSATGYNEVEYKTMTKQQEISITVDSDHYLNGNQAVSVVQDPDNPRKYKVTLNSYFGGIDLRVLKKAIEDATGGDVEIEDQGSSEAEETVPQMPIKVTNGYKAEVANADGAVQPARTLTLNMAQISPADMKAAILKAIRETPSGGVLRIETDMIACFDREIMEAFDERGDIDIELIFPNEGKKVRVFIPRGVNIEILLDEKGYCGFLRLASILGVVVYDTTVYNPLDVVTVSD